MVNMIQELLCVVPVEQYGSGRLWFQQYGIIILLHAKTTDLLRETPLGIFENLGVFILTTQKQFFEFKAEPIMLLSNFNCNYTRGSVKMLCKKKSVLAKSWEDIGQILCSAFNHRHALIIFVII